MKRIAKIVVVVLMVTFVVAMAHGPAPSQQNSVALSSSEMQPIVGGKEYHCFVFEPYIFICINF